jgi:hypothetical protein
MDPEDGMKIAVIANGPYLVEGISFHSQAEHCG